MARKRKQHPILVPVDFSAYSEAALIKACELADCSRQPVIVLHVVHDPADMPGYYARVTKTKKLARIQDLAAEAFMRKMIARYPEVKLLRKAETMLVIGIPVTRILEIAEKIGATMIVMGSQGRTGMRLMLLGSKSEQVVRLCPVPVTIVKASADD